jgi:dUTP pyrophosphatase
MKLKVKLDPGAYMPTRAHSTDAGLDLYAKESGEVPAYGSNEFDTGVHVEIPEGYVGDVKSKSGLMMNHNITTDGTVDCGYTGSVRVKLFNHSPIRFDVKAGQKIAQLVIKKIITPEPELVAHLDATERGNGGFGSTGAF